MDLPVETPSQEDTPFDIFDKIPLYKIKKFLKESFNSLDPIERIFENVNIRDLLKYYYHGIMSDSMGENILLNVKLQEENKDMIISHKTMKDLAANLEVFIQERKMGLNLRSILEISKQCIAWEQEVLVTFFGIYIRMTIEVQKKNRYSCRRHKISKLIVGKQQ